MAGFSHYVLQKAIYERLTGDSALMLLVSGVYDRPAQEAAFPYITIGDAKIADWSNIAASGTENYLDIHVWGRDGGRKQLANIMDSMYGLLHMGNIAVDGQVVTLIRFVSSVVGLEDDGWTYHGIMKIRVLLTSN